MGRRGFPEARRAFAAHEERRAAHHSTLSAAYHILSDLRDDNDADRATVFGMTTDAITKAMNDIRRRSGIEDLRFHDLRHEAISRLFEKTTLDVMEIKAFTGHKTMQMLARYTHLHTELWNRVLTSSPASRPRQGGKAEDSSLEFRMGRYGTFGFLR